ncbi:MAG: glycosyl hydrolase 108 family protein [Pseudomonadota bacterium]
MDVTEKVIDDILRREGGYVDDVLDRGGATNFGVTQKTLARWRGHPVSREDVRTMLRSEAEDIYRAEYVRPLLFALDDPKLFAHLVDCAINHGVGGATKLLQRALGITADGAFGARSMAVYRMANKFILGDKLIVERSLYYVRIVKEDPSQLRFLEGWMKRCMEFLVEPGVNA